MGLVRMDKSMVWAGLISLLIGAAVVVLIVKPAFEYYNWGPSDVRWMFILAEIVLVGIVCAMFVVAGVVLLLYGLLKNGITPPPPR